MKTAMGVFLFVLAAGAVSRADTVILTSGRSVNGVILEKTSDFVKIDYQGVPVTFYSDEVKRVEEGALAGNAETIVSPEAQAPRPSLEETAVVRFPEGGVPPDDSSLDRVYEDNVDATVLVKAVRGNGQYVGSGFVAAPGRVVTNFHVVAGAELIRVEFRDGRSYEAQGVVSYNAVRDYCVLKISSYDPVPIAMGDSDRLTPGEEVVVIGSPEGLRFSSSRGIYSGLTEFCRLKHLQFTAPISAGNSGGPLLNLKGEAVGIVTFKRIGTSGYNYAIPINEVKGSIEGEVKVSVDDFRQTISRAYELFGEAQTAYFAGDLDSAITSAKEAVAADPEYLEALYGLGELYIAANRTEEALEVWARLTQEDPNNVEARVNLAVSQFQKGMWEAAANGFEAALALDPGRVEALDNLGVAYARLKRYDKAVETHQKAVEANRDYAPGHYNLATAYYNTGRYDLAVQHCDRAARLGYPVPGEFLELLKPYR
ncbi:MAG: trypsin-like peptidase domain-containing protein [Candidatus Omnitrophota bacterium]|nr:trypsin-like peptidase domain-containing protein [Candidatus Omnitrophota bacterium]MDZ4242072.1 trypsin-like peptidase domain-containing protein [Candidatus Omnitrophota bacterium]